MSTATATETPKQRVSRIGKRALPIPQGVDIKLEPAKITIKGPKGSASRPLHAGVEVVKDGASLVIRPRTESGDEGAKYQGLVRALAKNMIEGVSKGYTVSMDLIGTGYRAEVKGQDLNLALGLSHPVNYKLPDGVKARVEILDLGGTKRPRLHLESHDKELLGQTSARIRSFRPPEPYKGKGVRYTDEKVREKAGKAGGKGKK